MNTLDIIILICLAPAVIRGISKGFLEQAVSFAALFISVWAAFRFSLPVRAWLEGLTDLSPTILGVASFAIVLVGVSLGMVLLGKLLTRIIRLAMLGWLDRLLGVVFALLIALLILGVAVILFNTVNTRLSIVKPEVLEGSVLYGYIKDAAYTVFPYLKELLLNK